MLLVFTSNDILIDGSNKNGFRRLLCENKRNTAPLSMKEMFKKIYFRTPLSLHKISSVIIDGAPVIFDKNKGFIIISYIVYIT